MNIGKKKLIEVALPLEAINKAAVREKAIRQGHPLTLHLWWARVIENSRYPARSPPAAGRRDGWSAAAR